MGWVKRGNSAYFYRSVRRGRRVRSVYFGDGPGALVVAALDAEVAAERAARTAAHAENRRITDSVDGSAARVADLVMALHDACLLLSGYHQDHNLKWRRVRERKPMTRQDAEASGAGPELGRSAHADLGRADEASADPAPGDAKTELALSRRKTAGMISATHAVGEALRTGVSPADLTEFVALVGRIDHDSPDAGDLVDLEWALAEHPGIWRVIADYGRTAIEAMIEQVKPSASVRLAFIQGAEELRAGLAGAGSSALEGAIAEQIAVCWVRLRIYEYWLSKATGQGEESVIRFWDERVSHAQRRFLAACRELATVRQLAARNPALLQINVAGQQINVARTGSDRAGPGRQLPSGGLGPAVHE